MFDVEACISDYSCSGGKFKKGEINCLTMEITPILAITYHGKLMDYKDKIKEVVDNLSM